MTSLLESTPHSVKADSQTACKQKNTRTSIGCPTRVASNLLTKNRRSTLGGHPQCQHLEVEWEMLVVQRKESDARWKTFKGAGHM